MRKKAKQLYDEKEAELASTTKDEAELFSAKQKRKLRQTSKVKHDSTSGLEDMIDEEVPEAIVSSLLEFYPDLKEFESGEVPLECSRVAFCTEQLYMQCVEATRVELERLDKRKKSSSSNAEVRRVAFAEETDRAALKIQGILLVCATWSRHLLSLSLTHRMSLTKRRSSHWSKSSCKGAVRTLLDALQSTYF